MNEEVEYQGQTVHETVKQIALEAVFTNSLRDPTHNLSQL